MKRAEDTTKKTIVIGYGNTLRCDDGAGVAAAQRLAAHREGADVMTVEALEPGLAELIAGYERAVFLDASVSTPSVRVSDVSCEAPLQGGDGHTLSPSGVIALSRGLYGHAPDEAMLVEIPAFECGFGERMSTPTLRMIDCSVQLVSELLHGETTPEILLCLAPSPEGD